jgi:hypothetical protein
MLTKHQHFDDIPNLIDLFTKLPIHWNIPYKIVLLPPEPLSLIDSLWIESYNWLDALSKIAREPFHA